MAVLREILILPIHCGSTGRIEQTGDGYLPMSPMPALAVRILNLQVELRQA